MIVIAPPADEPAVVLDWLAAFGETYIGRWAGSRSAPGSTAPSRSSPAGAAGSARPSSATSRPTACASPPSTSTRTGVERVAELPDTIAIDGDARDPEVLAELFAAVDERWGRVDTLVNVVGGTFRPPFTDTTPEGLGRAAAHQPHCTCCTRARSPCPACRAGGSGGSIVNLTTIECHRAAPGFAVYSAAKAAVEQFARTLAVELAPDRHPGQQRRTRLHPDTEHAPHRPRPSRRAMTDEAIRIGIPMGRAGDVTDVSNCVVFLASALSSYVTGTTIHPDGGTFASSGWFNWPDHGWGNNVPPYLIPHLGADPDPDLISAFPRLSRYFSRYLAGGEVAEHHAVGDAGAGAEVVPAHHRRRAVPGRVQAGDRLHRVVEHAADLVGDQTAARADVGRQHLHRVVGRLVERPEARVQPASRIAERPVVRGLAAAEVGVDAVARRAR